MNKKLIFSKTRYHNNLKDKDKWNDLDVIINYTPITPETYDSPKLTRFINDEYGQMSPSRPLKNKTKLQS